MVFNSIKISKVFVYNPFVYMTGAGLIWCVPSQEEVATLLAAKI